MATVNLHSCLHLVMFAFIPIVNVGGIAPPYYGMDRPVLEYELPPLDYYLVGLEPYIDNQTLVFHYYGHHATYTEKLNSLLIEWRKTNKKASRVSIVDILRNLSRIPSKWREAIKNNGGGYVNHNLYWAVMKPNKFNEQRRPSGLLASQINEKWTSYVDFKDTFTNQALNLFGSGYVWLCRNKSNDELVVTTTTNQDSPLSFNLFPILVIDVWEHAYYLKHQNLRRNYITDWWKVVDWDAVAKLDSWWKGLQFHDEL